MTSATPVHRSYLYAPGSHPHLVAKALAGGADAVVIDLEDAVAADAKEQARSRAAEVVSRDLRRPVFVRVNGLGTGLAEADVRAVARPGLAGIRLPKTESPEDVRRVAEWLDRAPSASRSVIVPLVESALGVERAWDIVNSSPRVAALGLGEADLRADLGVTDDHGLAYARSRCVNAARAAGVFCIQSVFPDVRDLEGLRVSTVEGRAAGFVGRSAIHPAQVDVIHAALKPSDEEIRRAREMVQAYGDRKIGVTPDGRFVDEAVVRSARAVLALAGQPADEDQPPRLR